MSRIRDRAENRIGYELGLEIQMSSGQRDRAIKRILSIPELAIVDRGAELPPLPELSKFTKTPAGGYRQAQAYMLKEGWVKEIK